MKRTGNRLIISLSLLLAVLLGSCTKNEFNVSFKLSPSISGNYRLLYYASDKRVGFMMEVIAPVEKGVGEAKCIERNPTVVYLIPTGSSEPAIAFYAERGDKIEITGNDSDPLTWSVGGNDINEEWSAWRVANVSTLRGGDAGKINAAVGRYVKEHPKSKAAAMILLTSYNRRVDEAGFAKLWNSLDEKARSEKLVRIVGRADLPIAGNVASAEKVGKLKLHAKGDSLVELNPARYSALMLYFRRNDDASYSDIDTLRSLLKSASGEPTGGVAIFSFETDSTSWLMRTRSDSLPDALNAWMPQGEMSEVAMGLNVPRTPFVIVCDSKGRQLYRGDNIGLAAAAWRKAFRPSKRNPNGKENKSPEK